MPESEVIDLDSANADQDSEDLRVGRLEGQRRIQTRATLLDERKVKPRREGDRLEVGGDAGWRITQVTAGRVGIASGNGRMLPFIQTRNCLIERRAEIRVGRAAVPNPPTGVHRQPGEVGESSDLPGTVRGAARQSAKVIEVDCRRAFRAK